DRNRPLRLHPTTLQKYSHLARLHIRNRSLTIGKKHRYRRGRNDTTRVRCRTAHTWSPKYNFIPRACLAPKICNINRNIYPYASPLRCPTSGRVNKLTRPTLGDKAGDSPPSKEPTRTCCLRNMNSHKIVRVWYYKIRTERKTVIPCIRRYMLLVCV